MPQFWELAAAGRSRRAGWAGATESDIALAWRTGIDPQDIRTFCDVTRQTDTLIVVRCPKLQSLAWHDVFPAKVMVVKEKTGPSGTVQGRYPARQGAGGATGSLRPVMVSDYDLMSVWRRQGAGWAKLAVTAQSGGDRGPFSNEATALIRALNVRLVTKIQHGCNDDWNSAKNGGVKTDVHFAAFVAGKAKFLALLEACRAFYLAHALVPWPYALDGGYVQPRS